ncbi:MAG: hypothetical protein PWQ85_320 [Geotoga sp.]|jgi:S-adenosylmethionine hydrolase|nr:hypothetical protein [Geotoga sp.]
MIAFITDWGEDSYYVSSVKSVIKNINKNAEIIDITHNMGKYDIYSYSHILLRASKEFQENTIFLVVIDPTVGSSRKAILVETNQPKYYFIAPDNGILTQVKRKYGINKIIELNNKNYFWKESNTFHGRDIFGAFAAYLSKNINFKYFGNELLKINELNIKNPFYNKNNIIGHFLYKDSFGNLETDVENNNTFNFDKHSSYVISFEGKEYPLNYKEYYSECGDDKLLMHFDSSNYLEISINKGSAASYLNIKNFNTKFEIKKIK